MRGGVDVMLLTGRTSKVVKHRADELGIRVVYQGAKDMAPMLAEILGEWGLSGECIAYVGDDVVDIPVFRMVGFSAAVADAPEYVRAQADYVTEKGGGAGAVREICDMIMGAQGAWSEVRARYGMDAGG
jgi:3-deoxy-D-manno-octulosonate 8-phosphate phosphatase (KDO 8-P phosphatase)